MKRTLAVLSLLAPFVIGKAVTVDFSPLGTDGFQNITTSPDPPAGTAYTEQGLTFSYLGNSSADTAGVNGTPSTGPAPGLPGIDGNRSGTLVFDFATPATSLSFSFDVLTSGGAAPASITDGLVISFYTASDHTTPFTTWNQGATLNNAAPINGTGVSGALDFSSLATPFDHAILLFAPAEAATFAFFDVNSPITFTPVPEPTAMAVCFGLGLCGYAVWRRVRPQGC